MHATKFRLRSLLSPSTNYPVMDTLACYLSPWDLAKLLHYLKIKMRRNWYGRHMNVLDDIFTPQSRNDIEDMQRMGYATGLIGHSLKYLIARLKNPELFFNTSPKDTYIGVLVFSGRPRIFESDLETDHRYTYKLLEDHPILMADKNKTPLGNEAILMKWVRTEPKWVGADISQAIEEENNTKWGNESVDQNWRYLNQCAIHIPTVQYIGASPTSDVLIQSSLRDKLFSGGPYKFSTYAGIIKQWSMDITEIGRSYHFKGSYGMPIADEDGNWAAERLTHDRLTNLVLNVECCYPNSGNDIFVVNIL
jgi:hypothetical protein